MFSLLYRSGRWRMVSCLLLCLLASVGCGAGRKGTVYGKVTYKGEPLGNGKVLFVGANNTGGFSTIAADGTYRVTNVPTGPVKISVETTPPANTSIGIAPAKEMPNMGTQAPAPGKYVKIPAHYRDAEQSGLTYDVKPGEQPHDINLD